MLIIRLTRTGKRNQAAYRLVVAEKTAPIKGKYLELLGFYNPADKKKMEFDMTRIEYWMSKGAQPTDTVASLLKTNGVPGMDDYLEPRNKKKKRKKEVHEQAAPVSPAVSTAVVEPTPAPEVEAVPAPEAAEPKVELAAEKSSAETAQEEPSA